MPAIVPPCPMPGGVLNRGADVNATMALVTNLHLRPVN
jgi:hypothetical protein